MIITPSFLLILNFSLYLSLILTGLIWTIQLIHYPSFEFVNPQNFYEFNIFHQRRMTYLVAPLMLFEMILALSLAYSNPNGILILLLLTLVLIWVSTFFLSVPLHSKLLNDGYNLDIIKKLVLTNWPRTIMWTLRSLLLIFYIQYLK